MTWDSVGAIGEILGALATIIMLVYLSIQVRHARETTQSATELEVSKLLTQFSQWIASDQDLQRTWDLVAENSSEISDEDLRRFLWHVAASTHAAEGVWEQYQRGFVSDRVWMEWERAISGLLSTPHASSWWSERLAPFSPEFYNYFDQVLREKNEWIMPSTQSITPMREPGEKAT